MQRALELADALMPRLAKKFHRQLLSATMQSVQESQNPLRLNNFSASFRELFRHILAELAPDVNVRSATWFRPDEKNSGKTTRAQKVDYVVHAGLDPVYVNKELGINITDERKALLYAIDRLSKFTHVNEESFASSPEEVEANAIAACEALKSFLDCAEAARKLLCDRVEGRIHEEVVSEIISETILSIDEIASHHCIDQVYLDKVEVAVIDHVEIEFAAYGAVTVELQWGSSSDIRRGEGAVGRDSYPFFCKFISSVGAPEELVMVEDSLCVDTSSWWDGYYDEEGEPV